MYYRYCKRLKRLVVCGLSCAYFGSQVLFANAAEANFWAERRRQARSQEAGLLAGLPAGPASARVLQELPSLRHFGSAPSLSENVARSLPAGFAKEHAALLGALPTAFGSVRKVSLPAGRPSRTVIHIQDVHQNEEAQRNIGQAVSSLVEKDQTDLVALEGAFEPIRLSGFRAFSRPDILRKAADYLLRVHKISGPIHSALTGPKAFPAIAGVDDPAHYAANVEAYRRSAPLMKGTKEKLAASRADLQGRKAAAFSAELLAFDRKVEAYGAGESGLGDHLKNLASALPAAKVAPSIRDFLATLEMETALDFKRVEAERAELVGGLVRKLSRERLDALMQWTAAYRLGQVRYADFYKSLQNLCRENGEDLSRFPAMDGYVRYVLAADRIDADRLMADMAAAEKAAYAHLAKTPEEKRLAAESRALLLAAKLADFSLTPDEWAEYEEMNFPLPLGEGQGEGMSLAPFESFYKEAHARDQTMADNLLKAMDENKARTAVLVTGGYHSPGVAEALKRAGVAVLSFTPKIEKLDTAQGSAYLGVFSREKTPLEKLFQGQKLFLATLPSEGVPLIAPLSAAEIVREHVEAWGEGEERGKLIEAIEKVVVELGLSPEDFRWAPTFLRDEEERPLVRITVQPKGGEAVSVTYAVTFDKEGGIWELNSTEGVPPAWSRWLAGPVKAAVWFLRALRVPVPWAEAAVLYICERSPAGKAWFISVLHRRKNTSLHLLLARAVELELISRATALASNPWSVLKAQKNFHAAINRSLVPLTMDPPKLDRRGLFGISRTAPATASEPEPPANPLEAAVNSVMNARVSRRTVLRASAAAASPVPSSVPLGEAGAPAAIATLTEILSPISAHLLPFGNMFSMVYFWHVEDSSRRLDRTSLGFDAYSLLAEMQKMGPLAAVDEKTFSRLEALLTPPPEALELERRLQELVDRNKDIRRRDPGYGEYSRECESLYSQLDQTIASRLAELDRWTGRERGTPLPGTDFESFKIRGRILLSVLRPGNAAKLLEAMEPSHWTPVLKRALTEGPGFLSQDPVFTAYQRYESILRPMISNDEVGTSRYEALERLHSRWAATGFDPAQAPTPREFSEIENPDTMDEGARAEDEPGGGGSGAPSSAPLARLEPFAAWAAHAAQGTVPGEVMARLIPEWPVGRSWSPSRAVAGALRHARVGQVDELATPPLLRISRRGLLQSLGIAPIAPSQGMTLLAPSSLPTVESPPDPLPPANASRKNLVYVAKSLLRLAESIRNLEKEAPLSREERLSMADLVHWVLAFPSDDRVSFSMNPATYARLSSFVSYHDFMRRDTKFSLAHPSVVGVFQWADVPIPADPERARGEFNILVRDLREVLEVARPGEMENLLKSMEGWGNGWTPVLRRFLSEGPGFLEHDPVFRASGEYRRLKHLSLAPTRRAELDRIMGEWADTGFSPERAPSLERFFAEAGPPEWMKRSSSSKGGANRPPDARLSRLEPFAAWAAHAAQGAVPGEVMARLIPEWPVGRSWSPDRAVMSALRHFQSATDTVIVAPPRFFAAVDRVLTWPSEVSPDRYPLFHAFHQILLNDRNRLTASPGEMDMALLNRLVTVAIQKAEALAKAGSPAAPAAYADVAEFEAAIAARTQPDEVEGNIARRGVVTALISAGEPARARRAAETYFGNRGIPADLSDLLQETPPILTHGTSLLSLIDSDPAGHRPGAGDPVRRLSIPLRNGGRTEVLLPTDQAFLRLGMAPDSIEAAAALYRAAEAEWFKTFSELSTRDHPYGPEELVQNSELIGRISGRSDGREYAIPAAGAQAFALADQVLAVLRKAGAATEEAKRLERMCAYLCDMHIRDPASEPAQARIRTFDSDGKPGEAMDYRAHALGIGHYTTDTIPYARRGGKVYVFVNKRSTEKALFPGLWSLMGGHNVMAADDDTSIDELYKEGQMGRAGFSRGEVSAIFKASAEALGRGERTYDNVMHSRYFAAVTDREIQTAADLGERIARREAGRGFLERVHLRVDDDPASKMRGLVQMYTMSDHPEALSRLERYAQELRLPPISRKINREKKTFFLIDLTSVADRLGVEGGVRHFKAGELTEGYVEVDGLQWMPLEDMLRIPESDWTDVLALVMTNPEIKERLEALMTSPAAEEIRQDEGMADPPLDWEDDYPYRPRLLSADREALKEESLQKLKESGRISEEELRLFNEVRKNGTAAALESQEALESLLNKGLVYRLPVGGLVPVFWIESADEVPLDKRAKMLEGLVSGSILSHHTGEALTPSSDLAIEYFDDRGQHRRTLLVSLAGHRPFVMKYTHISLSEIKDQFGFATEVRDYLERMKTAQGIYDALQADHQGNHLPVIRHGKYVRVGETDIFSEEFIDGPTRKDIHDRMAGQGESGAAQGALARLEGRSLARIWKATEKYGNGKVLHDLHDWNAKFEKSPEGEAYARYFDFEIVHEMSPWVTVMTYMRHHELPFLNHPAFILGWMEGMGKDAAVHFLNRIDFDQDRLGLCIQLLEALRRAESFGEPLDLSWTGVEEGAAHVRAGRFLYKALSQDWKEGIPSSEDARTAFLRSLPQFASHREELADRLTGVFARVKEGTIQGHKQLMEALAEVRREALDKKVINQPTFDLPTPASLPGLIALLLRRDADSVKRWTLWGLAGELAVFGLGGLASALGWDVPLIGAQGLGRLLFWAAPVVWAMHIGLLIKLTRPPAGVVSDFDAVLSTQVYSAVFGSYLLFTSVFPSPWILAAVMVVHLAYDLWALSRWRKALHPFDAFQDFLEKEDGDFLKVLLSGREAMLSRAGKFFPDKSPEEAAEFLNRFLDRLGITAEVQRDLDVIGGVLRDAREGKWLANAVTDEDPDLKALDAAVDALYAAARNRSPWIWPALRDAWAAVQDRIFDGFEGAYREGFYDEAKEFADRWLKIFPGHGLFSDMEKLRDKLEDPAMDPLYGEYVLRSDPERRPAVGQERRLGRLKKLYRYHGDWFPTKQPPALYVRASEADLNKVLAAALPVLRREGAPHRAVNGASYLKALASEKRPAEADSAIVVYPESEVQRVQILDELDRALLSAMGVPAQPAEPSRAYVPYGRSGYVYHRDTISDSAPSTVAPGRTAENRLRAAAVKGLMNLGMETRSADGWEKHLEEILGSEPPETRTRFLQALNAYLHDEIPPASIVSPLDARLLSHLTRLTFRFQLWTAESVADMARRVQAARDRIFRRTGREPVIIELAAGLGDLAWGLSGYFPKSQVIATDAMPPGEKFRLRDGALVALPRAEAEEQRVRQLAVEDIASGSFRQKLELSGEDEVIVVASYLPADGRGLEKHLLRQTQVHEMVLVHAHEDGKTRASGDPDAVPDGAVWNVSSQMVDPKTWISGLPGKETGQGDALEVQTFSRKFPGTPAASIAYWKARDAGATEARAVTAGRKELWKELLALPAASILIHSLAPWYLLGVGMTGLLIVFFAWRHTKYGASWEVLIPLAGYAFIPGLAISDPLSLMNLAAILFAVGSVLWHLGLDLEFFDEILKAEAAKPAVSPEESLAEDLRALRNGDVAATNRVLGRADMDIQAIDGKKLERLVGGPVDSTLLNTTDRRIVTLDSVEGLTKAVRKLSLGRGEKNPVVFTSDKPGVVEALAGHHDPERGIFAQPAPGVLFSPGVLHMGALDGFLPPEGQTYEVIAPSKYRPDRNVPVRPLESFLKLIEFLDKLRALIESQA